MGVGGGRAAVSGEVLGTRERIERNCLHCLFLAQCFGHAFQGVNAHKFLIAQAEASTMAKHKAAGGKRGESPVFRINSEIARPAPKLISAFAKIPAANISDAAGNLNTMDSRIQALVQGARICGPACTVSTRVGDFLSILQGLHAAKPGDVLVVGSQGSPDVAVFGEITSTEAKMKGLAGLVTDARVRDIEGIRKIGFPVFAHGTSPRVAGRGSLGEVNVPTNCGGVVVEPGDIIVGDADGVVVVPRLKAAEILRLSHDIVRFEEALVSKVRAGLTQVEFFNLNEQFAALLRAHRKGHGKLD
jgi:regulator of RNase E activity RraA